MGKEGDEALVPEPGGDVAAAVVAVLGIVVLSVSVVMAVSPSQSQRLRARLVSGSGVSLATILFVWAVARSADFVRL